ncbi:MAG: hypothetical protein HZC28_00760 [Spirochaetes bacterium]|nr:hypothetical protein [Spirochaetota bacterium]
MSYDAGWKALNLEMTDRVPRTEYSAHTHWDLVKRVTGIDTAVTANRAKASSAFLKSWDYAFMWSLNVYRGTLKSKGGRITDMGHATYAENNEGKSDFRDTAQQPFTSPEEIYNLDMFEEYGHFTKEEIVADFNRHYSTMQKTWPDTMNMAGVYITMFSGLIEIMVWDLLLVSIGTDEVRFGKFVDRYFEWIKPFFDGFAACDVPVMMSHDDLVWTSGPVAHPDWYRKYIFPHIKKLWKPVKEAGKKLIFTCDGTWTDFFDDIMEGPYSPDMVVMEPTTDMALFAEKYGKRAGFVGNADCRILLSGTKDDIHNEVKRCMDIGKKYPGFIMAVGNHLPSNTPVDNALWYNDCYEKLSRR